MGNRVNNIGIKLFVVIVFGIVAISKCSNTDAARLHKEDDYNTYWCEQVGGEREVRLDDGSRVDCLTDTHAIEADFADKHYNGVGQALHYSAVTGKKPGLLIIVEDAEKDARHIKRMMATIDFLNELLGTPFCSIIDIWMIYPNDLSKPTN